MRRLRSLILALLPMAAAACQQTGAGYDRYQLPESTVTGSVLNTDQNSEAWRRARARDRAIYEAELAKQRMQAGSLSAQQRALLGARIHARQQGFGRASSDLLRAERQRARAERDLRQAERLDRSPVFTGPFDRADARRRAAELEARRKADLASDLANRASRRQSQIYRLQREQAARNRESGIAGLQASGASSRPEADADEDTVR